MRTNKKRLYESIMKDVSKTIKKKLNENTTYSRIQNIIDQVGENMFYEDLLEMIPDNIFCRLPAHRPS